MNNSNTYPRFTHDCDRCVFLGHQDDHDHYYCASDFGGATIIARYDDDGPDYVSGIVFKDTYPLDITWSLAKARGLV